jgi:NitT/TauT family transport system substrate-binding protein
MVPAGSPALSQLYVQADDSHYTVDVINGSDPLVAAFSSQSHDVIFAPTNLGAKLYNAGSSDYLFAGTIVWGNYYLVGKGQPSFTLASLAGKTITVFGQNSTSDIIMKYILAENGLSVTIEYVDAVATASAVFMADQTKIILSAEPSLSVLASKVADLQIIDIQAEYQKITGSDSYPQAGVFVRPDLDKTDVSRFLQDLADSIDQVNADPEEAATLATSFNYGFEEAVLVTAIGNSHLRFASATDSQAALEAYFTMILAGNAVQIGGKLPDHAFYYIP